MCIDRNTVCRDAAAWDSSSRVAAEGPFLAGGWALHPRTCPSSPSAVSEGFDSEAFRAILFSFSLSMDVRAASRCFALFWLFLPRAMASHLEQVNGISSWMWQ